MATINTVLFDLDGTLIDTAPDMAAALNLLCEEEKQATLDYATIRPRVSDGSVALVKLAFGDSLGSERLAYLKQRYLDIYQDNLAVHSKLFDQIDELFTLLQRHNIRWGVVTNKPGWLTLPLMQQLNLAEQAACIVSGDTTENRKPHPEPMYHACKLAGSTPEQCLYIGDASRDIEAGINAGMKTMVARYGYIEPDINPDDWNADYYIDSPAEISRYLGLD